jgi:hypothetical protein
LQQRAIVRERICLFCRSNPSHRMRTYPNDDGFKGGDRLDSRRKSARFAETDLSTASRRVFRSEIFIASPAGPFRNHGLLGNILFPKCHTRWFFLL